MSAAAIAIVSDCVARSCCSTRPPTSTKYPVGSSKAGREPLAHVRGRAAQVAPGDARFDGDPPAASPRAGSCRARTLPRPAPPARSGSACRRAPRAAGCGSPATLLRAGSASRTTRSYRRCPTHTSDTSSPTSPIRSARTTSPGVRPVRATAARSIATRSCGRPVTASTRRSSMPSTSAMIALRLAAEPRRARRDPDRTREPTGRPAFRRALRRCACRAAS